MARLSESGAHRVLLLEAGGSERSLWIRVPVGYARTFHDPRYNWMYEAEPDPALDNRRQFWPRGKVLGGSGSINAVVYVRGQPADFDDWRDAGNSGWSWAEVLPWFRKLEDHCWGASEFHGAGGPIYVSDVSSRVHPLCQTFLAACAALEIPATRDFNGAQPEGAGLWQVSIKNGARVSTATAYLRPATRRANLDVQLHALATRVLFYGTRASGVEYEREGLRREVRARCEVLLCGGAINSPQLLELSGVGDGRLLQRLGIKVIADSPAVGVGLQDHLAVNYYFRDKEGLYVETVKAACCGQSQEFPLPDWPPGTPPAVIDKRRAAMDAKNRDAWKPNRDRKVSAALRAYAALTTSASTGAALEPSCP